MAEGEDRWERVCEKCFGKGCEGIPEGNEECEQGVIVETAPPGDFITSEGAELFEGYRWLKNYGLLPAPGTWRDQTEDFLRTVDLCDSVGAVYSRRKVEKDAAAARAVKMMAGLFKGKKGGR